MFLRTWPLLPVLFTFAACASTGGVPQPFPVPRTSSPSAAAPRTLSDPSIRPEINGRSRGPSVFVHDDGYAIAGTALSLRGTPYRNGGAEPASGFDCSGFVQFVYGEHGFAVPRGVRDQYAIGKAIPAASLEPGDLLFFTTTAPGASHVGIAIGGDQFVHAPSSAGTVRVENLSSTYWAPRFVGARRLN